MEDIEYHDEGSEADSGEDINLDDLGDLDLGDLDTGESN